ncbi:hypothetical protein OIE62_38090 [Streptomyces scopuliridis]|uniref:Uncharacterized protein n=1 Tax=Streptomyces scopuliridis TaxID=452529 RepID=A0ACD4ZYA2_9ACTN|nr:hypothetical protein [Streptomyces scopuliridis]WSC03425.1 hypothetical protein OG835_02835 [Streptomyces scopuliridis]WSC11279.1 hypothetical protein OIE62_38090 [Streptomyces scopuliridis]
MTTVTAITRIGLARIAFLLMPPLMDFGTLPWAGANSYTKERESAVESADSGSA